MLLLLCEDATKSQLSAAWRKAFTQTLEHAGTLTSSLQILEKQTSLFLSRPMAALGCSSLHRLRECLCLSICHPAVASSPTLQRVHSREAPKCPQCQIHGHFCAAFYSASIRLILTVAHLLFLETLSSRALQASTLLALLPPHR